MKKLLSVVLFVTMLLSLVLCVHAENKVTILSPGTGGGEENLVEKVVIEDTGEEVIIPELPEEVKEKAQEWYREDDEKKKQEIEEELKKLIEEKFPRLKDLRWIIIEHFHDEWPEEVEAFQTLMSDPVNQVFDRAYIESIIGAKLKEEYAILPLTGYHYRWIDFPVTGYVDVPQLEHFKVLYCLHYSFTRNLWEVLEFEQQGTELVMYNIQDVSPFVLITEGGYYRPVVDGRTSGGGKKSPKTDDVPLEAVLGGVMLLCVAGAAVVLCRRKA